MKKSEAKVGVRVRVKGLEIGELSSTEKSFKGLTGTIKIITPITIYDMGVVFDEPLGIHGHDLNGLCKDPYGRYGYFKEFEVIKKRAIKKKGNKQC